MKKNYCKLILIILVAVALSLAFTACNDGDNSHEQADDLTYVTLADGTYSVTAYTGTDTELTVPASYKGVAVTEIADGAFSGGAYTSVTVSEGITKIGKAFDGCSELKTLSLPSTIKKITPGAFDGTAVETAAVPTIALGYMPKTALKKLDIISGLSIGENAFAGCTRLEELRVADSVTSVGVGAFNSCVNLATVTCNSVVAGYLSNPNLKTLTVTSGERITRSFANSAHLQTVTIADSVKMLADQAFMGCTQLSHVSFGGLQTLGARAFQGCTALEEVTLPDSLQSIGSYAFSGCSATISWGAAPTIQTISESAFNGYLGESVTIPSSVTSVSREAFLNCANLKRVYITDLKAWCETEFEGFDANPLYEPDGEGGLVDTELYVGSTLVQGALSVPDGTQTVGSAAFAGYGKITSVVFPQSVTAIRSYAFSYCKNLADITVNGALNKLGGGAFQDTAWFESRPDNSLIYIKDILYSHKGTLSGTITVAPGTRMIAELALSGCREITDIELPSSLRYIDNGAFMNCTSLDSLTIPDDVTYLGTSALQGCTVLRYVIMPASVREIGASCFYDIPIDFLGLFYLGTTAQWDDEEHFTIGPYNFALMGYVYFYSPDLPAEPEENTQYWHYDQDTNEPVSWEL